MIFRTLSRLIILVIGVVVLAELVSKDEPEQSKPFGAALKELGAAEVIIPQPGQIEKT